MAPVGHSFLLTQIFSWFILLLPLLLVMATDSTSRVTPISSADSVLFPPHSIFFPPPEEVKKEQNTSSVNDADAYTDTTIDDESVASGTNDVSTTLDDNNIANVAMNVGVDDTQSTTRQKSRQQRRPVVGILSQPKTTGPYNHNNSNNTHHYIAASYVKWIESAGATSIPIPYDAEEPLVREIFSQINGILFPGGDAPLPPSAQILYNLALESNARGEYFPVWGTCLGFEFLIVMTAAAGREDDEEVLQTGFVSHNISLPLVFPTDQDVEDSNGVLSKQSALYPDAMRYTLLTENITMNNHVNGISPQKFLQYESLTSAFYITSTNVDQIGQPFVSTIESIHYPIYGVQYHPEKNNFEYGLQPGTAIPYEAISHSDEAVELSLHLAQVWGKCLRKSTMGEYTLVERHPLLMDYPMVRGIKFEQEYIIPPAIHWNNRTVSMTSRTMEMESVTSSSVVATTMGVKKLVDKKNDLERFSLRGSAVAVHRRK